MDATASLVVGDDPCLKLPKSLVLRRRDSADGSVNNISCDAKFNIRHDGLYHILQSTSDARTPYTVADETTTVGSSVYGEDGIEWESILVDS